MRNLSVARAVLLFIVIGVLVFFVLNLLYLMKLI